MARDIEGENDYYKSHGGIIPVKWTAPEVCLVINNFRNQQNLIPLFPYPGFNIQQILISQ